MPSLKAIAVMTVTVVAVLYALKATGLSQKIGFTY
jgi:hypothetical protein